MLEGRKYYIAALSLIFCGQALGQKASVAYHLDSAWQTGLQAGFTVTNTGSTTLTGWTLSFDYPYAISSIWDARIRSKSGTRYTLEGPTWNKDLPPGGQAWIGWIASTTGTSQSPSGCAMPGVTVQATGCSAGSTASDTTPPTVPANLKSTGQTTTTVTLQWDASSDGAGGSGVAAYDVRQGSTVIGTTAQTSFVAQNLTAATSYTFSVRARDNAGNNSNYTTGITVSTAQPVTCTQAPSVPTGLAVSAITPNSATLTWKAVTAGAGCTVTYRLWVNGTMLNTPISDISYLLAGLTASTQNSVAVSAVNQVGSSLASTAVVFRTADQPTTPVSGFPTRVFAPYADMLLWPTPDLASISQQTGVKYFTAAFVVSGGGCQASWGGVVPTTQTFLVPEIDALRAAGGDVIVSFGGAFGIELGQACTTVASLQSQYQSVIDKFKLTRIDFDIEGGAVADPASIDRRNKAIAGLQAAAKASGKSLTVQYTLPVLPSGLTLDGVNLLKNAVQNGVDIGIVNIMAMDYGNAVANPNAMGQAAINAINATFAQMKAIYGSAKSDAQLRAMQGVTPMIGLNDVSPEVFTLSSDAGLLLNFATTNKLGLLAMWSIGRDHACPGGPQVSATCSGVSQGDYGFAKYFFPFTGQ
ncbi:MAG: cellulose binding domain-containing protein [Bryobacteraceae bacterium]